PAGILAALHELHHRLFDRRNHIEMPYADGLRSFAAWFVQLWAESLGKRHARDGRRIESGPTPLPAVGATDQHAQVQLFMEGPRDKLLSFLTVENLETDLTIPKEAGANAYLGERRLGELLAAEAKATAMALATDGRPSVTLRLERLDAENLGEVLFLWEAATAIAGELYGIDAFDQPGVELGKRLAFGLLGRDGYEAEATKVAEFTSASPRYEC
ncbi:MAG: glucose-6-phosphate isomerase, partial [Myxococcota bacterium]